MSEREKRNARIAHAASATSLAKRGARRAVKRIAVDPRPLSWGERLDIIDALVQVLDGVYAHLPLKRSLYGFDVVRALEHLRQQLPTMTDLQFHRELTFVVNRLRDAHTQYQGPWNVKEPVASLPFLVEAFGPADEPTYLVTKVDRRSVRDPHFVQGVTIDYWNGIPVRPRGRPACGKRNRRTTGFAACARARIADVSLARIRTAAERGMGGARLSRPRRQGA